MKVKKRNGELAGFDANRIVTAVEKAFEETGEFHDKKVSSSMAYDIQEKIWDNITVEEIQDMVEDLLMAAGYKKTAKAYIRYRYKRNQDRMLQNDLEK